MFPFRRKEKPKKPLTPEMAAYFATPEGMEDLKRHFSTPEGKRELARAKRDEICARHPALGKAVWGDASIFSSLLMGPPRFSTKPGFVKEAARLALESDAFLPMVLYRMRTRLLANQTPVLPDLLHHACMVLAQLDIGRHVVMEPGVYIPHGQVVIDGEVTIGSGTVISPWVTLGRNGAALQGPKIGSFVFIGTGAKILGPVTVGDRARIGANAVVLSDVPAHTTVGGIPARILKRRGESPGAADSPDLEKRSPSELEALRVSGQVKQKAEAVTGGTGTTEALKAALRDEMAGRDDEAARQFREAIRQERLRRAGKG